MKSAARARGGRRSVPHQPEVRVPAEEDGPDREWPPAEVDLDARSDPADWGAWADDYRFLPAVKVEGRAS